MKQPHILAPVPEQAFRTVPLAVVQAQAKFKSRTAVHPGASRDHTAGAVLVVALAFWLMYFFMRGPGV
jgi:hypothetical protein